MNTPTPIDRRALVSRHDVAWTDPAGVMPLGNGEFGFNADGTGLQTFGGNTMAHWAWHRFPLPPGITPDQIPATGTFQQGRPASGLAGDPFPPGTEALHGWMRHNPHGFNLGRLRLRWSDGRDLDPGEITRLSARLDLWTGVQTSRFELAGQPVSVVTCVHPTLDAVAVRVRSPLLASGKLVVALDFSYPSFKALDFSTPSSPNPGWAGDFSRNDAHTTSLTRHAPGSADLLRRLDATAYHVRLGWSRGGRLHEPDNRGPAPHAYTLDCPDAEELEVTCLYADQEPAAPPPSFAESAAASTARWEGYWTTGGALDLSGSQDPRWPELERRVVLSQYHMAAQSAGSFPPAEAGLMTVDQWGGRFHMEMLWWHLAHYALWDRWGMATAALGIYDRFLPQAEQTARQLGFPGAVWPKGVGPDGISQPWHANLALLWKQPHPMFFAELDYRLHPDRATLERWDNLIRQTAEYMAAYPVLDPQTGRYSLDPVMPPGEQAITADTPFDLAYWRWGLDTAQRWRERLGLTREEHWDAVRQRLAPLPVADGVYPISAAWRDPWTKHNVDHPDPVGVLGMLPPIEGVDHDTAHRTLLKVWAEWKWESTWGWDFPWTAMAAARLGEPQMAVDALLMDVRKNGYDWRGVNVGGPCPYLPGNGGLLYAVAMMAAGWDGAPDRPAPGFPADGSWTVRWENLAKAL